MADRTVVVLGAGTGGLVVAHRLRRLLDKGDRVVLVDRESTYWYAPSFLWVMTGARQPERITADLRRVRRRGIELLTAEVLDVDPERRRVKTSHADLSYDRLVVCPGAELAPELLPGFAEAARNVYTLPGATAAGDELRRLDAGRVAVVVSRLPYKCPAAPYEAAFLAEALLRRCGAGERTSVDVYTPEPYPMPTAGPILGEALAGMLAARGIGFHPGSTTEQIDPERRELVLTGRGRVGYDLLLGVPPHRAPRFVAEGALAGASGFVPVDPATLQTGTDGIYAVGDVAAVPIADGKFLPKAGVFAHAEAEVVARRIADELAGREPSATFDGTGGCFVELGDGRAAYAAGRFFGDGGPQITLRRPGRHWHAAKVAFEQYWMRRWF